MSALTVERVTLRGHSGTLAQARLVEDGADGDLFHRTDLRDEA
jgi:hypothetical protein